MTDILKKISAHLKKPPFQLYRKEGQPLTPMGRKPFGTILTLVVTLGLFFSLLFLLWGREHYNVSKTAPLINGLANITAVSGHDVDPEQVGRPIYFSGKLGTETIVEDPHFKLKTKGIAIRRIVEMYQRNQAGAISDRNEHYRNEWSSVLIDPSKFSEPWFTGTGVTNSFFESLKSQTFMGKLKIGQFYVTPEQVKHLMTFKNADLDMEHFANLPADLIDEVKLYKDQFYLSESPESPKLGDVRFYFQVAEPIDITVMATMSGQDTLSPLSQSIVETESSAESQFFDFGFVPRPSEDLSGDLFNTSHPFDPVFALSTDSLSLKRIVDIYTEDPNLPANTDGGVPGKWVTLKDMKTLGQIGSVSKTLRESPGFFALTSETFFGHMRMGDYIPQPQDVIGKIRYKPSPVTLRTRVKMPDFMAEKLKLSQDAYYTSDAENPKEGDVRIRFEVAEPQIVTLRGPLPSVTGNAETKTLLNVQETFRAGIYTFEESINRLVSLDTTRIWVERALSFVLLLLFSFFFTFLCRILGSWDIRFQILYYALYRGKGAVLSVILGVTAITSAWAGIPPVFSMGLISFLALGLLWFWILTVREGQVYR